MGNTAPAITLDTLTGGTLTLSHEKGRVTVLNFWYTTCGPCLEELPHFNETAIAFGDALTLITVHRNDPLTDAAKVQAFLEENHADWLTGAMTHTYDKNGTLADSFRVQAYPVTVVIDGEGIITARFDGKVSAEQLHAAISSAAQ